MRILGGIHKGRYINAPSNLPVRPTTGFAFEGLFNMLSNRLHFENLLVLDLFSGTGHLAYELASRGAASVQAVDKNGLCLKFIKQTALSLSLPILPVKADVFQYLESAHTAFDFIFADPPFALTNIEQIHALVKQNKLLKPNGLLIIEHGAKTNLQSLDGFEQQRTYGNVNFSFFSGM